MPCGGLGGRGQVRGSPGFREEEDSGSPENSRSHRPCTLRERLEAWVSRADSHRQVRGCGSKWDGGTEVSGLKQGVESTVMMPWLLAKAKERPEPAHCIGLGPGEAAGGPGWSELLIEKSLRAGLKTAGSRGPQDDMADFIQKFLYSKCQLETVCPLSAFVSLASTSSSGQGRACPEVTYQKVSKVTSVNLDAWEEARVQFMASHGNNIARDTYESKVPSYYWPTFSDCHLLRKPWIRAKYKQRREFTHTETQEPYSAGGPKGSGQVEWKEAPPQHCQVPGVGLHDMVQGIMRAEVTLGRPCSCLPPWDRTRPPGNLASGPWILVLELRSPGPNQGHAGQSPSLAQSMGPTRSCHKIARSPCLEHTPIAWTSDCRVESPVLGPGTHPQSAFREAIWPLPQPRPALEERMATWYRKGFLWKQLRDNGQLLSRKLGLTEQEGVLKNFNRNDRSRARATKEPKASMKIERLKATFQPAQIGHTHGLQVTYLKDNSTRNIFVYHEDGKVDARLSASQGGAVAGLVGAEWAFCPRAYGCADGKQAVGLGVGLVACGPQTSQKATSQVRANDRSPRGQWGTGRAPGEAQNPCVGEKMATG
ncbi:hypothetical protein MC885_019797 [Smutsia gigantea]|nr:hypothetical protein MC885_019797 [Smutsia gigantea]